MVNKTFLSGNLTRNPELRYTPASVPVCEFTLANNRRYISNGQQRDEVCYIDVTIFGKHAEACSRYLQKGSSVLVEGYLSLDQWEGKEGQKRSKHRINAERVEFLDRRDSTQGDSQGRGQHRYNNEYRNPR